MWGCSATGGSQIRRPRRAAVAQGHLPDERRVRRLPVRRAGRHGAEGDTAHAAPVAGGSSALRDATAVAVDGPEGAVAARRGRGRPCSGYGEAPSAMCRSAIPNKKHVSSARSDVVAQVESAHIPRRDQEAGGGRLRGRELGRGRHQARCVLRPSRYLASGNSRLLVGPGTHCGWTPSQVKADTGFDIVAEEASFLRLLAEGRAQPRDGRAPAVTYYTYNAPAGKAWQTARAWPPRSRQTDYFLTAKALSTDKPAKAGTLAAPMVAPVRISSISVNTGCGQREL